MNKIIGYIPACGKGLRMNKVDVIKEMLPYYSQDDDKIKTLIDHEVDCLKSAFIVMQFFYFQILCKLIRIVNV